MDAHKTIQTLFHVLGIVMILGFLALQGGSCMLLMSAMGSSGEVAQSAYRTESVDVALFGDENPEATFLQIPIFGVIRNEPSENRLGMVTEAALPQVVSNLLLHARESDEITGLLVDIDSPGGAVDPSDVIFHELRKFRRETGKPIIARMNGVAASGGFYIAMGADAIIAHPSCITGSIGVIMQNLNYAGLFDRFGVELVTLTSGPNKDLFNPGKPVSDEHKKILMSIVDDAYDSFVEAVAAGRGMDPELVRPLADGRIYTARQALELGLIDRIGYDEDLLEMLRETAGVEAVEVVTLEGPTDIWDLLGIKAGNMAARLLPGSAAEHLADRVLLAPGLYYLWDPGF